MVGFYFLGFTVIVGLLSLGTAASFALRPGERKLAVLRPFSVATVFSAASSLCAGLGLALKSAANAHPNGTPAELQMAAGFAEAMVPPVIGFALLAVAWLLAGVGLRRQD